MLFQRFENKISWDAEFDAIFAYSFKYFRLLSHLLTLFAFINLLMVTIGEV